MTALVARRQKNLRTAGAIGAVCALFMVLSIVVGVSTLANSDAGRDVTGGVSPDRYRLPATATAAIGLVDDDGGLVSVAVLVLRPDGEGGNVVVIPATADVTPGLSVDVTPESLSMQLRSGGRERFELHLEALSAVSLDHVEVIPTSEVLDLLEAVAPLRWTLPEGLSTETLVALVESEVLGRSILPGMERELTDVELVAAMSWSGPQQPSDTFLADRDLHLIQVSLWTALLSGLGGRSVEIPLDEQETPVAPLDLNEFLMRLGAGVVGVRGLVVQPTTDPAVVALDRAEVLLVFGQIAPSRVAAPNESSRFRVVASLTGEQQSVFGASNADLARDLIAQLLFLDANIVSVQASDPVPNGVQAPVVTVVEVADAALGAVLAEQWARVFGDFEIKVVEVAIEGVDATIIIGMNYVPMRAATGGTPQQDGTALTAPSGED
jgi:hypothetical protein